MWLLRRDQARDIVSSIYIFPKFLNNSSNLCQENATVDAPLTSFKEVLSTSNEDYECVNVKSTSCTELLSMPIECINTSSNEQNSTPCVKTFKTPNDNEKDPNTIDDFIEGIEILPTQNTEEKNAFVNYEITHTDSEKDLVIPVEPGCPKSPVVEEESVPIVEVLSIADASENNLNVRDIVVPSIEILPAPNDSQKNILDQLSTTIVFDKEIVNDIDPTPRIDVLSMPTVRQLIAAGHGRKSNEKVVKNLEKTLCYVLNKKRQLTVPHDSWDDYLQEFLKSRENRPDSQCERYKFSRDDLDHPIFYETYQRYGTRARIYNFRGIPKAISKRTLNYRPTDRIVELAKPMPRHARYYKKF